MILKIRAFFFDANMDYLPYYKNFSLDMSGENSAKEILTLLQKEEEKFSFLEEGQYFKINSLVVDGHERIENVVERFGHELLIEPMSVYRAVDGLVINDDDFMQSFSLLEPYATADDLEYYRSLYPVHYASSTFRYDNDYIGDAILILASNMVQNKHADKEKILDAISNQEHGLWECEYENGLFESMDYSKEIDELKEMCGNIPDDRLEAKFNKLLMKKYNEIKITSLFGLNVAFYNSDNNTESRELAYSQILAKGANVIEFDMQNRKAGQELFGTNSKFGALKSGTMLLDAMDSGADVLVVFDGDDAKLFKQYIGLSQKTIQRDIGIKIITNEELINMQSRVVA